MLSELIKQTSETKTGPALTDLTFQWDMSSVSPDMSPDSGSPSGQNWDARSPEGKGSYVDPDKAPLYPILEGIREGFLEKETSAPRSEE